MKKNKNRELAMNPKNEKEKLITHYIPNVAKKILIENEKRHNEKKTQ